MEKEKFICIEIKELMALCHILDDFEEFNKNAVIFFKKKDKNDLLNKLFKIAVKNERSFNDRKAKKFYEKNKKVINTIKEHYYVWDLFCKRYCSGPRYNEELIYMYNYIKENREELDKIIAVLEKIKDLEVREINFNKDFDFTNETYKINTIKYDNVYFTYLDNLEAIPSYESDKVKYKTTSSNYKIKCKNARFFWYGSPGDIYLNSLTFDEKRLPEFLDDKEIHNKLLSLKDKKKEEYDSIRNSVDLNIKIEEMSGLANTMEAIIEKLDKNNTEDELIENLDKIKRKKELKENLLEISKRLSKIQSLTGDYEKEVISNSNYITSEVLEKEKTLYKKREMYSYIHH